MTKKQNLKIIPLGGMDEIGKNITLFEYGNDIMIIDCGLTFPDDDMLGVDLVIPDMSYILKNQHKIRGIVLTHGHEDHIGALPYLLKNLNVPVYATKLTNGLVGNKLREHNLFDTAKLINVKAGDKIKLGVFTIEFIRSTHSIADAVALAITTPLGVVIHTGDFKIDYTPIEGEMIDLARFGQLGNEGVLLLMADSTNVERPGHTLSERTVSASFNEIFRFCNQRIIVATFASNVHRVQQILNASVNYGRKVALCGRSMINVVNVARELGYITVPENTFIDVNEINKYPKNKVTIITTGSQGEPMSALTRIALSEHKLVDILPGDLVVISASPIPGNEKSISRVINELYKKDAEVIYEALAETHVSGHACKEELKLMHSLVRPKYFVPVHGEHRHLKQHAHLAHEMGLSHENIFILESGKVFEINDKGAKISGSVPSGNVLVDGLGVGDVGNIVLRDRQHLAQDGLIVTVVTISVQDKSIIAGPDIISRGFVYVRESEDLMEEAKKVAKDAVEFCVSRRITDWSSLKSKIKGNLNEFLYEKTKRKPMILPIIMEI